MDRSTAPMSRGFLNASWLHGVGTLLREKKGKQVQLKFGIVSKQTVF